MKQILVNISEKEHILLKKDAHKHEMNVSEYVRWLVKKERENNDRHSYQLVIDGASARIEHKYEEMIFLAKSTENRGGISKESAERAKEAFNMMLGLDKSEVEK